MRVSAGNPRMDLKLGSARWPDRQRGQRDGAPPDGPTSTERVEAIINLR
jgi:hypothetical protein